MNFFDIIDENNNLPYAAFYHKIKWNVTAIAGHKNANGYIVQKVNYFDSLNISASCNDYYEAWTVCDGICKDTNMLSYDDSFSLDALYDISPLKNSLGKQGCIKYNTFVYWIDIKHELYKVVNSWNKNCTPMAGELKTIFENDCPEFKNVNPIFSRNFVHSFDCRSEKTIIKAIRSFYSIRISKNDPTLKDDLHELLDETDYAYLIAQLCPFN